MGATEEQMQLLNDAGITHVSYVLILYSVAFILFLCMWSILSLLLIIFLRTPTNIVIVVNILLHIYAVHAWPEGEPTDAQEGAKYTHANGRSMNGRARTTSEATRIQDAEAFELQGLISDEEEEAESSMGPKQATDEEMAKESAHH